MRITLGVTGGVAAYKAAELVRQLQQEGHSISVVMTRAAREFVTPLTFAALTGQKVITDLFGDSSGGGANLESAIEHIAVAQRTDLLLVAPATAEERSEEHTSELQSHHDLVCRLLLEKKNQITTQLT